MLQYKQSNIVGNSALSSNSQARAPAIGNSAPAASGAASYQRETTPSSMAQPHHASQNRTALTKSTPPPHPFPVTAPHNGQVYSTISIPQSNRHQQPTPPSRVSQSSSTPRETVSHRYVQAFQSPRPTSQQPQPLSARQSPFPQYPRQTSAPKVLDQTLETRISTPRSGDAEGYMEIWLVRHGETPENRSRVIAGHCSSGLTETGSDPALPNFLA